MFNRKRLVLFCSVLLSTVWVTSLFFDAFFTLGGVCVIELMGGEVSCSFARDPVIKELSPRFERCGWQGLGLKWPSFSHYQNGDLSGVYMTLPLWIPAFVLLLAAIVMLRRKVSSSFGQHCMKCNYDLTGNKSGVCPECGQGVQVTPPESPSISAETSESHTARTRQ